MRLQGKFAFITGAARGIGAACARKFVAEGARVAIADVLEEEGRQLATELVAADSQTAAQAGRSGGVEGGASTEGEKGDVGEGTRSAGEGSGAESIPRAIFVRCDVCDCDSIASALAEAVAALSPGAGALHVLVNNAALQSCKSLPDTAPRDWDTVIAASLSSVFHATQLALPYLRRAERGAAAIVNVSSSFALVGSAGYAAYHAAKGGVSSLTRAAALGLVAEGVRVNAVCLGTTLTPGLQEVWEARGGGECGGVCGDCVQHTDPTAAPLIPIYHHHHHHHHHHPHQPLLHPLLPHHPLHSLSCFQPVHQ
ncbi:unnamed protein product [Closterium sp. NIES-54]